MGRWVTYYSPSGLELALTQSGGAGERHGKERGGFDEVHRERSSERG